LSSSKQEKYEKQVSGYFHLIHRQKALRCNIQV